MIRYLQNPGKVIIVYICWPDNMWKLCVCCYQEKHHLRQFDFYQLFLINLILFKLCSNLTMLRKAGDWWLRVSEIETFAPSQWENSRSGLFHGEGMWGRRPVGHKRRSSRLTSRFGLLNPVTTSCLGCHQLPLSVWFFKEGGGGRDWRSGVITVR